MVKTGFASWTTRWRWPSVTSRRTGRRSATSDCSGEAAQRLGFRVEGLEDGHQFGNHQQIVNPFGHVQQLQAAAATGHRRMRSDNLTNPRAVDVRNLAEIENDLLASLVHQAVNLVFQLRISVAEDQFPLQVQDGHGTNGSLFNLHWPLL